MQEAGWSGSPLYKLEAPGKAAQIAGMHMCAVPGLAAFNAAVSAPQLEQLLRSQRMNLLSSTVHFRTLSSILMMMGTRAFSLWLLTKSPPGRKSGPTTSVQKEPHEGKQEVANQERPNRTFERAENLAAGDTGRVAQRRKVEA